MVDYAEEADFVGRGRRRRRSNPEEVAERRAAKAAARTPAQWRSFARDIVYRQLGAMDRSELQLRQALERQLVPGEIIDETIAKFVDADLVNDDRYAKTFVRSRFESKATSRRALRQDLKAKGIEGEQAENALEQVTSDDEFNIALEFARKKSRSLRAVEPLVAKRRLFGALGRRGFDPALIMRVVTIVVGELESSDDADPGGLD